MFQVEKPFLLQQTVERMNGAGLVYHFRDKAEMMFYKLMIQGITSEMLKDRGTASVSNINDGHGSVSFSDSIVAESFVLFLYLRSICVMAQLAVSATRSNLWN